MGSQWIIGVAVKWIQVFSMLAFKSVQYHWKETHRVQIYWKKVLWVQCHYMLRIPVNFMFFAVETQQWIQFYGTSVMNSLFYWLEWNPNESIFVCVWFRCYETESQWIQNPSVFNVIQWDPNELLEWHPNEFNVVLNRIPVF